MILHTMNKSPYHHFNLMGALEIPQQEDFILLYEDGVYAGIEGTEWGKLISLLNDQITVCALEADVEARGLMNRLVHRILLVDYDGFVDLTIKAKKILSW